MPFDFKSFTPHELDLCVKCHCGADTREECVGLAAGVVHFGRRLRRLLAGLVAVSERT